MKYLHWEAKWDWGWPGLLFLGAPAEDGGFLREKWLCKTREGNGLFVVQIRHIPVILGAAVSWKVTDQASDWDAHDELPM